jgi:hypothetical protein
VTIPKSSTTFVRVPVAVSFGNIGAHIKEALSGQEVPYKFAGQAQIAASFASTTVPFIKEGRINLNDTFFGGEGFRSLLNKVR